MGFVDGKGKSYSSTVRKAIQERTKGQRRGATAKDPKVADALKVHDYIQENAQEVQDRIHDLYESPTWTDARQEANDQARAFVDENIDLIIAMSSANMDYLTDVMEGRPVSMSREVTNPYMNDEYRSVKEAFLKDVNRFYQHRAMAETMQDIYLEQTNTNPIQINFAEDELARENTSRTSESIREANNAYNALMAKYLDGYDENKIDELPLEQQGYVYAITKLFGKTRSFISGQF
jgi:hypothetical protein